MYIKARFLPTQTNYQYPRLQCLILLFYIAATYYLLFEVAVSGLFLGHHAVIIGIAESHILLIFVLVFAVGPHLLE